MSHFELHGASGPRSPRPVPSAARTASYRLRPHPKRYTPDTPGTSTTSIITTTTIADVYQYMQDTKQSAVGDLRFTTAAVNAAVEGVATAVLTIVPAPHEARAPHAPSTCCETQSPEPPAPQANPRVDEETQKSNH